MRRAYPLTAIAAALTLVSGAANALLIDNFADQPQAYVISATGIGTETKAGARTAADGSGTNMIGNIRDFDGTTINTGTTASGDMTIQTKQDFAGNDFLSISNEDNVQGTANVKWDNDGAGLATAGVGIDLTADGTAIVMDVLSIDTGVTVEMIVKNVAGTVASSGVKGFGAPGVFFVNFADFTNSSVFTDVNSIELVFNGSPSWDGSFDFIRSANPPTSGAPIPGTIALMGIALAGLGRMRRRKA